MQADALARDKLLKSKKTRRYVAELSQMLGLRGVLQLSPAEGSALEVPVAAAPPGTREHTATLQSGALGLSWRGPQSDERFLPGLLYAIERFVETERASAEVSRHALEKYRELALLYKFGEGLTRITRRQDLMDLSHALLSSRVEFDCFFAALPMAPPGGWELLQPAGHRLATPDASAIRFETLSRLLSDGNSRILSDETSAQSLWDASVFPTSSVITVPMSDGGRLLGGLVCARTAAGKPFSSEDEHLLNSFGFLFTGKLADINLLEKMLKDERMVAIGSMASSIIHDVKNPLTSVMAFAELLGDLDFSPEERREYSGMIVQEVQRLTGMIEDLLEFTRGGRSRYEIAPFTPASLLEEVSRLVERDMKQRDIKYTTAVETNDRLLADKDKLKRVLLNLAGNARDAMEPGGSLRISVGRRDDMGHISVEDNGPGIPEEIRDRLFEPFVTHGKKGGTGLGTAISRKIVEDMGGRIWFDSARGRGTTFHVQLPLA